MKNLNWVGQNLEVNLDVVRIYAIYGGEKFEDPYKRLWAWVLASSVLVKGWFDTPSPQSICFALDLDFGWISEMRERMLFAVRLTED
jgi:hypothetical protein